MLKRLLLFFSWYAQRRKRAKVWWKNHKMVGLVISSFQSESYDDVQFFRPQTVTNRTVTNVNWLGNWWLRWWFGILRCNKQKNEHFFGFFSNTRFRLVVDRRHHEWEESGHCVWKVVATGDRQIALVSGRPETVSKRKANPGRRQPVASWRSSAVVVALLVSVRIFWSKPTHKFCVSCIFRRNYLPFHCACDRERRGPKSSVLTLWNRTAKTVDGEFDRPLVFLFFKTNRVFFHSERERKRVVCVADLFSSRVALSPSPSTRKELFFSLTRRFTHFHVDYRNRLVVELCQVSSFSFVKTTSAPRDPALQMESKHWPSLTFLPSSLLFVSVCAKLFLILFWRISKRKSPKKRKVLCLFWPGLFGNKWRRSAAIYSTVRFFRLPTFFFFFVVIADDCETLGI